MRVERAACLRRRRSGQGAAGGAGLCCRRHSGSAATHRRPCGLETAERAPARSVVGCHQGPRPRLGGGGGVGRGDRYAEYSARIAAGHAPGGRGAIGAARRSRRRRQPGANSFDVLPHLVGGDRLHPSISAASILAKTARDAELVALDASYPQYGFAQHKGYGTPQHLLALRSHGPCAIHRRTFGPVAQRLLDLEPTASRTVVSDQPRAPRQRPSCSQAPMRRLSIEVDQRTASGRCDRMRRQNEDRARIARPPMRIGIHGAKSTPPMAVPAR